MLGEKAPDTPLFIFAAPADIRLFSLPPLVASAEAKSLLAGKNCYIWQNSKSVAPIWRDNVRRVGESSLGGASEKAQSYWQGRFAACAFVDCSL
ncbi:MAG: hypothetical protein EGS70_10830 [Clostridiales bacterium]|nr:hypothetical protein [Clostridiales bacterium]